MDIDAINANFDLLAVVEQDAQVKKSGAWWIGPCPFCGGVDRFNLRKTPDGYKWFCRHCGDGKYHSALDYVIKREGLTLRDAAKRMDSGDQQLSRRAQVVKEIGQDIRKPSLTWQERGKAFAEESRKTLWKDAGKAALEYLHSRGLADWILVKYGVGYNPTDRVESLDLWGLDGDGQVSLPRGITLPAAGGGNLYYIKFRLPSTSAKKYIKVRGSKPGVFGYRNMANDTYNNACAWLAVITEGEFDTMILDQQAGFECCPCTFGSASDSPSNIDDGLLRWYDAATYTLAAYDNDDAGRDGAAALQDRLPDVHIITMPDDHKDINDFHLAGGDIPGWLCRQIEQIGITL